MIDGDSSDGEEELKNIAENEGDSSKKQRSTATNHLNKFFAYEHNRNPTDCIYDKYSNKIAAECMTLAYGRFATYLIHVQKIKKLKTCSQYMSAIKSLWEDDYPDNDHLHRFFLGKAFKKIQKKVVSSYVEYARATDTTVD
jgi:hypothetical protein